MAREASPSFHPLLHEAEDIELIAVTRSVSQHPAGDSEFHGPAHAQDAVRLSIHSRVSKQLPSLKKKGRSHGWNGERPSHSPFAGSLCFPITSDRAVKGRLIGLCKSQW